MLQIRSKAKVAMKIAVAGAVVATGCATLAVVERKLESENGVMAATVSQYLDGYRAQTRFETEFGTGPIVGKNAYTLADNLRSGTIDLMTNQWGQITYEISGLTPNVVYKASADVKVQGTISGAGAVLSTAKYVYNSKAGAWDYYNFAWSKEGVTTSGAASKKVEVFFIADKDNKTQLSIGTAHNGSDGKINGKIEFANLKIEPATDAEVKIVDSTNGKIRLVMPQNDYAKLTTMVANPAQAAKTYADKLEEVYYAYGDFAGQNSSGHGNVYPFAAEAEVLNYTNVHNYGALAGRPIEFSWNASDSIANYVNKGEMGWGELHELGHTFDHTKTTVDGMYEVAPDLWNFNAEFWANEKALYAIDKGLVRTETDMFEYFGQVYRGSLGDESGRSFTGDGLSYLFFQTKNAAGEIDWEAMRRAFQWFNDLSETRFLNNTAQKYGWYVKKYAEYQTAGHKNIRDVLMAEPEVNNVINERFGYVPISSISLAEASRQLESGETYTLSPEIAGATTADLVYASSNPEIATVDEFGKVQAHSSGTATITASSFTNPEIARSMLITVPSATEPGGEESGDKGDESGGEPEVEPVEKPGDIAGGEDKPEGGKDEPEGGKDDGSIADKDGVSDSDGTAVGKTDEEKDDGASDPKVAKVADTGVMKKELTIVRQVANVIGCGIVTVMLGVAVILKLKQRK